MMKWIRLEHALILGVLVFIAATIAFRPITAPRSATPLPRVELEDVDALVKRQRAELREWGERNADKPNSIRALKAHLEFYYDELPLVLSPIENRGPLVDPADLQPPVVEVPEDAPKPPMAPEPLESTDIAPRGTGLVIETREPQIEIAGYVRVSEADIRVFTPAHMTAGGKEPENWALVFSDSKVRDRCVLDVLEKQKSKPTGKSPGIVAWGWKGEDDKLGRYQTIHVERYEIAQ